VDRHLLRHRVRLGLWRRGFGGKALVKFGVLDKRDGHLRLSRRRIIRKRIYQGGGHNDGQLRDAVTHGLGLEELAEDRNVSDARDLGKLIGRTVVEEAGNAEALIALQLDLSFGAAGRYRGNRISGDDNFIAVVEGTDLGSDFELNRPIGENRRGKVHAHAVRTLSVH